jgi:hypothetical protein
MNAMFPSSIEDLGLIKKGPSQSILSRLRFGDRSKSFGEKKVKGKKIEDVSFVVEDTRSMKQKMEDLLRGVNLKPTLPASSMMCDHFLSHPTPFISLRFILNCAGTQSAELSVQQLLDCADGSNGCETGGSMTAGPEHAMEMGLLPASVYPEDWKVHEARKPCRADLIYSNQDKIVKPKGYFEIITGYSEKQLVLIYLRHGAVAVRLTPSLFLMAHYREGIISEQVENPNKPPFHLVQIVGWTTHPKAGLAWVFRNTWGLESERNSFVRDKFYLDSFSVIDTLFSLQIKGYEGMFLLQASKGLWGVTSTAVVVSEHIKQPE